jgi:DNA-binding NarL/FixJ family response regulator
LIKVIPEIVVESSLRNLLRGDGEGVVKTTPPGVFVGRREELEMLESALLGLAQGGSGCVVVSGEPGIGKTALVRELLSRASERGMRAAVGRGTEFEQDVPFGVAVDALDPQLVAIEPRRLEQLGKVRLAELASVFPSLGEFAGELASGLQVERYRLHHAVRRLTEELAHERPVVLALDDLHWADQASIELIAHLLRRRPDAPLLLCLAYRPRQASPRLLDALAQAAREGAAAELELAPFSEREAEALLGDSLDKASRHEIYRESGGNPFYLTELARGLPARENGGGAHPRWSTAELEDDGVVPAPVQATIAGELARLSETAHELLRAAAVAGEPFAPELAGEIAELAEAETLTALDELLERDLVRAAEAPRRFQFRHPIVRRAVYQSAGRGYLLAAHARAARALRRHGASATAQAHHVERSADPGDQQAITLLTQAGQAAAPRAPATAARWFEAALALLPEDSSAEQRLGLLVPRATALATAGRVQESRVALTQALELIPPELAVVRGRVVGAIARLDHLQGNHAQARTMLERVLDDLEDRRTPGAATVGIELAIDFWVEPDFERMASTADEVVKVTESLGDRALHGSALSVLALAEYYQGRTDRSLALASAAREVVDALTDEEVAARIEALLCLGHAEFGLEQFATARDHLRRGVSLSRVIGEEWSFAYFQTMVCVAELWLGRLREAAVAGNAALESALLGPEPPQIWAFTLMSWVTLLQGDLPAAVRTAERAVELAQRGSPKLFDWLAHCRLAAALVEAGEAERGREIIIDRGGGPDLAMAEPGLRGYWWEILAQADIARGRLEAAAEWVDRAERLAADLDLEGRTAEARRARGALELARGDHRAAAQSARDATVGFERVDRRIDAARARTLAGRALGAIDEVDSAVAELQQAHAELHAMGAARYRDEAARELRRLGRPVRRQDSSDLTRREREVAELVAAGMTNRAIAAELHVSEKTVETHLGHVFKKLGVSSRSAVRKRDFGDLSLRSD